MISFFFRFLNLWNVNFLLLLSAWGLWEGRREMPCSCSTRGQQGCGTETKLSQKIGLFCVFQLWSPSKYIWFIAWVFFSFLFLPTSTNICLGQSRFPWVSGFRQEIEVRTFNLKADEAYGLSFACLGFSKAPGVQQSRAMFSWQIRC